MKTVVAFWAVLIVLLAAFLRADYKDNYRRGIQAVDRGDWSQPVAVLRKAIAEQPA